jgi:signal recognition particle subunit SRP54
MSDMLNAGGGGEEDASKRMKRLIYIMDAMTTEELDSDGSVFRNRKKKSASTAVAESKKPSEKASGKAREKDTSTDPSQSQSELQEGQPRKANRRLIRVARGSGTSVREVEELLSQHQMFSGMVKQAGGKQGFMAKAQQAQQRGGAGRGMGSFSPQQIAAAQQRMQSMGMGGMDLQAMMRGAGGGGGAGGGMPDMASLQRMAQQMGLGSMLGGR